MTNIQIEELLSKDNLPILKINGYYIHSRYNPLKEAQKVIEKKYKPHNFQIIFGYGSGYLVDALLDFQKYNETLIIIDPLLDNSNIQIAERHKKLLFVNANDIDKMEDILIYLKSEVRTEFNIFCTNNYDKLFPVEYKELLQKIRNIQEANRVNDNTMVLFSEKWQENLVMNLNFANKDTSIIHLKNKFEYPLVIASSGPSLSKQIEVLKKYRKKLIVISAGSTINILLNEGIQPDFIVTIDGGEANYNHFKNLEINNSTLIYSLQNHPKIRDSFKNQAFICNIKGQENFSNYVNKFFKQEIPSLIAGSTVANLAFSFAQYISSGPIAFIGQDLAFTDNLTHAVGHNHVKEINTNMNSENVLVEGYYGEKVATSASMNSMRLAFERMILVQPPKNIFYNCTEGGAKIKGYKQIAFNSFCEKYAISEDFQIKNSLYEPLLNSNDIKNNFKEDLKIVHHIKKYCERALKTIAQDYSINKFKSSTLKKLDQIDLELSKLSKEITLDNLLTPTILAVKTQYLEKGAETLNQKFKRIKEQNIEFYSGGLKAAVKFENYVKKALKLKEDEGSKNE